jgi:hypothetical protein
VLLEKYQQASAAAQAGAEQLQQPGALAAAAAATAGGSSKPAQGTGLPVNAVRSGPPLLLEEAVAVIIRNERGRQVGDLLHSPGLSILQGRLYASGVAGMSLV